MEDYSIELPKDRADKLIEYLKEEGIYFEPSECFGVVYIMIRASYSEVDSINSWLDKN